MRAYTTTVKKYYKWGDPNVTLVGSPTVTNGVVSGFSTAKYLVIPNSYKSNNATYVFKFTTGSSFSAHQVVVHGEFLLNLEITTGKAVQFYNWGSGASYTLFNAGANKTYWVKVIIIGINKTYSYSTDGKTFTNSITITDSGINTADTSHQFRLGLSSYNSSSPFLGSFDLKDCYIKQGEHKIWTGLKIIESTSSNYDFSEDVDIYKAYKTTVRKYYKYTNWTQPKLTANGTMGGSSFACNQSASLNSTTVAFRCFNGDTTTGGEANRWQINNTNTSTEYYIYWYNPVALKISNLKVWNEEATYVIKGYTLYGSNDNSSWVTIKSGTNTVTTAKTSWNIPVSMSTEYKYFRLGCKPNSTTAIEVMEIQITATTKQEGNEKDYTSYEDVNVYKLITGFNRKYYKYTYKNWTQPKLTTNGTIGGSSFAVTQSNLYNAEYAYCAFDANESTQWTNNGNTGYLVFYNPMPLNVTKISVMNGFDSSYTRPISSGTLLASNDGNSYKTIKTFTNSNKTAKGVWNIDASSNTGYYKYYKLNVTGDGSYARITTLTVTAKERSIVEGTESDYVFFKDKYTSFGITE